MGDRKPRCPEGVPAALLIPHLQVEVKTTPETPDAGNLQRAADFVHAFILGFEVQVRSHGLPGSPPSLGGAPAPALQPHVAVLACQAARPHGLLFCATQEPHPMPLPRAFEHSLRCPASACLAIVAALHL